MRTTSHARARFQKPLQIQSLDSKYTRALSCDLFGINPRVSASASRFMMDVCFAEGPEVDGKSAWRRHGMAVKVGINGFGRIGRNLARAWLRVIWRCWTDHTRYQPERHNGLQRQLAAAPA